MAKVAAEAKVCGLSAAAGQVAVAHNDFPSGSR